LAIEIETAASANSAALAEAVARAVATNCFSAPQ